ncbi:MAG: hypothetical protein GX256_00260 [Fretibacterium sp.]|nr:hypothetical protein [Fretibacterium sp.]
MRLDISSLNAGARLTPLDSFDPRARFLCGLALAIVLASVRSFPPLVPGALIPLLLFFSGDVRASGRALVSLNVVSAFVGLLLALTYPGGRVWGLFSREGLRLGVLIALKLNLISVLLFHTILALGVSGVDSVLSRFGVSEKLRVLLLLSTRSILILMERVATRVLAVRLRGPDVKGLLRWKTLACMLGTTLLHSSDRAERAMLAIRCRGGLAGFSQGRPMIWSVKDALLCLFFGLNVAAILLTPFVWRL